MDLYSLILLIILAFSIGYIIGQRKGVKKGFKEGLFFAPNALKKQIKAGEVCRHCGKATNDIRQP